MQLYTIWAQGRRRTDTYEEPVWLGKIQGESFQEACDKFFSYPEDRVYYNSRELTYRGSRLFDNEEDARN